MFCVVCKCVTSVSAWCCCASLHCGLAGQLSPLLGFMHQCVVYSCGSAPAFKHSAVVSEHPTTTCLVLFAHLIRINVPLCLHVHVINASSDSALGERRADDNVVMT